MPNYETRIHEDTCMVSVWDTMSDWGRNYTFEVLEHFRIGGESREEAAVRLIELRRSDAKIDANL